MATGNNTTVLDTLNVKELRAEKFGLAKDPVAAQAAYTQTYSTASRTHPAPTATTPGTGADASTWTGAQCTAAYNDIIALNKLVVSLIDDLQAQGLAV